MQYISQTVNVNASGAGSYLSPILNGKLWGYQVGRGSNRAGNLAIMAMKPSWAFLVKDQWPLDLSPAKPVKMPVVDDTGAVVTGQYEQCLLVDDTIAVNLVGGTPNTSFTIELWID
jgi:hypothetical protein